jgi:hypothetical protein
LRAKLEYSQASRLICKIARTLVKRIWNLERVEGLNRKKWMVEANLELLFSRTGGGGQERNFHTEPGLWLKLEERQGPLCKVLGFSDIFSHWKCCRLGLLGRGPQRGGQSSMEQPLEAVARSPEKRAR